MIENDPLKTLLTNEGDWSTVVEIYSQDAVPTADGFDPGDALDCYAAIDGISFMGVEYKRLIKSIGNITRTITSESNSASVEFSNLTREISYFEFNTEFEGLIMVIRLISRNSSTTLDDSMILFTGRCEKPASGNKDSLSVTAKWILGGLEVKIPRRKYTKEDQEGRVETDPEFEGFVFIPQEGTSNYRSRVRRGGLLFFLKKWVTKTLAWSSFSDLDANKDVPEVLGRSQVMTTCIGYTDLGTEIRFKNAACEGKISAYSNVRSLDPDMPLNMGAIAYLYGDTGSANGPDDPAWPAPGYHSRTAHIRLDVDNSIVDVNESAPDVVVVVNGRLMTVPDTKGGTFSVPDTWTDNPAAHARWLITDDKYFNLDENWINDTDAVTCFDFNNETIIQRSQNDLLFAQQG